MSAAPVRRVPGKDASAAANVGVFAVEGGKTIHVFPPPESKVAKAARDAASAAASADQQPSTTTATQRPTTSLQDMVDAAKDGDCIYIQPGTHTLAEPLFISGRKKVFLLGFVESHTESEPPTLRMKVTAPSAKRSVFAALVRRGTTPLRPMVQLQEGCDAFFSHVRFEYEVEYLDELPDEDLPSSLLASDGELPQRPASATAAAATSSSAPTLRAGGGDKEEEEMLLKREQQLRQNKLDAAGEAAFLGGGGGAPLLPSPRGGPRPASPKANPSQQPVSRPNLPTKACAIQVTGAGTQATFNCCTILSGGHGIVFRCTATSVGAQRSFVQSPRIALRDGCRLESSNGTCIVIAAQDEGTAIAAATRDNIATTSLHSSSRTARPPEGVVHVARCSFANSLAGIELSGPVHVRIADCDFEACQVALAGAACMQMQLHVSETLFAHCSLGTVLDAPAGAGSSRDIAFRDCRYDQCERGMVLEGPDCVVAVDGCVFTRCAACAVCVDGGGGKATTFSNCVLQQNDVAVEVIAGRPTFQCNTFHNNIAAGAIVSGPTAAPTFRECSFTNTGEGMAASTRNRLNSDFGPSSSSSSAAGSGSHRRSVRCAAVMVEQDATPLVEYSRFENNVGANCLILSAFGVFSDNVLGSPGADSYNVVVSGPRACPKFQFNVLAGNDRGQARPAFVVEDGAAADVQQNDFVQGRSSAVVCRRSGAATVIARNRIQRFLEGILAMERAAGLACKNESEFGSGVEVFQDSKGTFAVE